MLNALPNDGKATVERGFYLTKPTVNRIVRSIEGNRDEIYAEV